MRKCSISTESLSNKLSGIKLLKTEEKIPHIHSIGKCFLMAETKSIMILSRRASG